MIEMQMVKRRIPNGTVSRLIYRSAYVVIVAFVACTIPFFGGKIKAIPTLGTFMLRNVMLPADAWCVLQT